MRVVGLDLSMTSTGYAEYADTPLADLHRAHQFVTQEFRTDRAPTPKGQQPTLAERHERLQDIEDRLIARIYRFGPTPDLVVVEAPSSGSVGYMQHDISGNWWRVVGRLLQAGLRVAEVSPPQVKKYATGSGATRGPNKVTKSMIVDAVNRRYDLGPVLLGAGQHDMADAVVLAAIGCRLLGDPVDPYIPAVNLTAVTKIRLPERLTLT
jgi:Holliday junction resolvasome RuvABC endonuclease subunit